MRVDHEYAPMYAGCAHRSVWRRAAAAWRLLAAAIWLLAGTGAADLPEQNWPGPTAILAKPENELEDEPLGDPDLEIWWPEPPTPGSRSTGDPAPPSLMSPAVAAAEAEFFGQARRDAHDRSATIAGFQVLPPGLMYRSYLAGEKEPRFQTVFLRDSKRKRRVMESALGGRVGLLRQGTHGAVDPQGFQLDLEGAALSRVLPDEPSHVLEAVDFRFGLLGTWRADATAVKLGYYHISSHLGDEFLIDNPTFVRSNYVRDAAIVGVMREVSANWQVYGEVGYAVGAQGGARPLEFQVGSQYASATQTGKRGSPFFGINSYTREDSGFRGSMNLVAGWQWVGAESRHRFRAGLQYFNGPSLQYSFPDRDDRLLGGGLWFDF